jgi:hypothetical protein
MAPRQKKPSAFDMPVDRLTPSSPSIITNSDVRPIPDPTVRTTEQLQREIMMSRELIETLVTGQNRVIETRFDGMDVAIKLLQTQTDRLPQHILDAVHQLQSLHEEKFRSIETQFVERDTRTEQTSRDSKVAVDAALQAAKEAVGEQNKSNALAIAKSEATFTKQIDQIGVLISTLQKGLDEKIDDLRARLQAIESMKKGAGDLTGVAIAVVGVVVAFVLAAAAVAAITIRH